MKEVPDRLARVDDGVGLGGRKKEELPEEKYCGAAGWGLGQGVMGVRGCTRSEGGGGRAW